MKTSFRLFGFLFVKPEKKKTNGNGKASITADELLFEYRKICEELVALKTQLDEAVARGDTIKQAEIRDAKGHKQKKWQALRKKLKKCGKLPQ